MKVYLLENLEGNGDNVEAVYATRERAEYALANLRTGVELDKDPRVFGEFYAYCGTHVLGYYNTHDEAEAALAAFDRNTVFWIGEREVLE